MKILHVGGHSDLTNELAQCQRDAGHEVRCVGIENSPLPILGHAICELEREIGAAKSSYELIHFHGHESLCAPEPERLASIFKPVRESGTKVVYQVYSKSEAPSIDLFTPLVDFILVSNVDACTLTKSNIPNAWLPLGVPIDNEVHMGDTISEVRFLHIPFNVPAKETKIILETLTELQAKKLPLHFDLVKPEEIQSNEALTKLLRDCHVLIEQIESSSYGALALKALAHGKAVLSGNSPEAQQKWEILKQSPVIHTTAETLKRKLEGIVREPKCLRDYGKRSRTYIAAKHAPRLVTELVLDIYKRLLA